MKKYFESGMVVSQWTLPPTNVQAETPYYRYTVSEWSQLIAEAGFLIRRIYEPRLTSVQAKQFPELAPCHELPFFLIFDVIKLS